jgi:hypothetical protein
VFTNIECSFAFGLKIWKLKINNTGISNQWMHANKQLVHSSHCWLQTTEVAWQITYMLGSLFVPCQPTPVASLNTFYVFCVRFIVRESDFRFLRPGRAKLSQPQPQHTHLVIYHSSYVLYTFDHSDRDRQRAQHAEKNRFCCWLDPDLHKCHSIFSNSWLLHLQTQQIGIKEFGACVRAAEFQDAYPSLWYLPFFNYIRAPVKILIAHFLKTWPRTWDIGR